ncbi:hypothetical protein [Marinomonas fungiae]|uniref:hypothetical protein n=1 Tax=Marinomonas fungiae TaxID=1137284 RepID=UPI003A92427D
MGLFGGSNKTTQNQTQSIASQSQMGDSFASANDINVNVLDQGAVQSALSLADRVVANNQLNSEAASAASLSVINNANNNATALSAQINNNAIALAGEAIRSNTETATNSQIISQQAMDRLAAEAAASRESLKAAQDSALAVANASREQAISATTGMAREALAASTQAQAALTEFANTSFERLGDSSEAAILAQKELSGLAVKTVQTSTEKAMAALQSSSDNNLQNMNSSFMASLNSVNSNAAKTQDQMGAVLTDVLTQGQAGLQASASKSMVWIVGIAAAAVIGVAMMKG